MPRIRAGLFFIDTMGPTLMAGGVAPHYCSLGASLSLSRRWLLQQDPGDPSCSVVWPMAPHVRGWYPVEMQVHRKSGLVSVLEGREAHPTRR